MKNNEVINKQILYIDQEQGVELLRQGKVEAFARLLEIYPKLSILDLNGCNLKMTDLQILADVLAQNSTLIKILLQGNNIDDQGAEILSKALAKNKTLEFLDLGYNELSFKGAKVLEQGIAQNHSLKYIELEHNSRAIFDEEFVAQGNRIIDKRLGGDRFLDYKYLGAVEFTNWGMLYSDEMLADTTLRKAFYCYKAPIDVITLFPQNPALKQKIEENWIRDHNITFPKLDRYKIDLNLSQEEKLDKQLTLEAVILQINEQELKKNVQGSSFMDQNKYVMNLNSNKEEIAKLDLLSTIQEKEQKDVSILTKCNCSVFTMMHIKYDNILLNMPETLQEFQVKFGVQRLNQLIDLSSTLTNAGEGFKRLLTDICNDSNAFSQLELLMGLDSNNAETL